MIRFVVPGEPVAKGRGRIGRTAEGRPCVITPPRTRNFEALVKLAAQQAMAGREPYGCNVPLSVLIVATMTVPASWSPRKQQAAVNQHILPTKRPDLDKFLKAAFDGCNGVIFSDDCSIVRLESRKEYGPVPGLTVQVVPLTTVEGA